MSGEYRECGSCMAFGDFVNSDAMVAPCKAKVPERGADGLSVWPLVKYNEWCMEFVDPLTPEERKDLIGVQVAFSELRGNDSDDALKEMGRLIDKKRAIYMRSNREFQALCRK
jgi:hypothetical protein